MPGVGSVQSSQTKKLVKHSTEIRMSDISCLFQGGGFGTGYNGGPFNGKGSCLLHWFYQVFGN